MDTAERTDVAASTTYDGFISYSHAADDLLAPRLQSGLQRFAKPWWKRRALRIFRDESSLSANPHLWSSITEALDNSGWFVLLLSPDAAESQWVNQEIEYWKTHKDPSRILPVLTDGTFEWTAGDVSGTAVPEQLQGSFTEEPRWVDMRFARDETDLDLKDPRFADAVADIASALRGVPKDELASEEVKQHRRTIRTAWTGMAAIAGLALAATLFGVQSATNAERAEAEAIRANQEAERAEANAEAEAEARTQAEAAAEAENEARLLAQARELGASAINVLDDDPELAILLALEAIERTPTDAQQPVEVINALWQAVQEDRLVEVLEVGSGFVWPALSDDGSILAVASENESAITIYSTLSGEPLWSYSEETSDSFGYPDISPDGEYVAVGIWDSDSPLATREVDPDEIPARIVVLSVEDGTVVHKVEYPDCQNAIGFGWTPQGSYFAVSHMESCPRPEAPDGSWVELLNGKTLEQVAVIDVVEGLLPLPAFDAAENLYVFGIASGEGLEIYRSPSFELDEIIPGITGGGDISSDGALAVTFDPGSASALAIFDAGSGVRVDLLRPLTAFPRFPVGNKFSADGSKVIVSTEGENTLIWDVGTGEQTLSLKGGSGTQAVIHPDDSRLYTGHTDGTIQVWNLGAGGELNSAGNLGSHRYINGNAFSIGSELGSAIAVDLGAFDFRMVFFDKETGSLLDQSIEGAGRPAQALADGRFVVNVEGEWLLYDPRTDTRAHLAGCRVDFETDTCVETGDIAPEVELKVSIDGTEIAIFRPDVAPGLIDPDDGSTVEAPELGVDGDVHVFSADWIFATEDEEDPIQVVFDRTSGAELARFNVSWEGFTETSATGNLLVASTGLDEALTVVDTRSWQMERFPLDLGRVRGIGVAPGDDRIALGDESGLHILDLESGDLLQSIPLPSVSDIHWIDPDTVLIGTTNGVWVTIPLQSEGLTNLAENSLTRSFTAQECELYRIDPCPTLDEIRGR